MPTLLTSTSIFPWCCTRSRRPRARRRCRSSRRRRARSRSRPVLDRSTATFSRRSAERAVSATSAPASASAVANTTPSPYEPPVTSATLPFKFSSIALPPVLSPFRTVLSRCRPPTTRALFIRLPPTHPHSWGSASRSSPASQRPSLVNRPVRSPSVTLTVPSGSRSYSAPVNGCRSALIAHPLPTRRSTSGGAIGSSTPGSWPR